MLSVPVKHTTGRYYAPGVPEEQVRAALRAGAQPERRRRTTSPACATPQGNVLGLMPHPEHAVDPLTGLRRRRPAVRVARHGTRSRERLAHSRRTASSASPTPSTTPSATRIGREPNALELAVFSLMWSEHCAYKHSQEAAARAAHRGPAPADGPGRERRRGGRGRRAGGRVQGRVAQPPERGRAVPGRGHRRRRHPARHLRGRARARSRCSTRCASASSTRRARATCSTGR